jgi:hypothetical protein
MNQYAVVADNSEYTNLKAFVLVTIKGSTEIPAEMNFSCSEFAA